MMDDIARILAMMPDGVVVTDSLGIILYCNPAAAFMFQRLASDLIGEAFGFPIIQADRSEITLLNGRIAEMRMGAMNWDDKPALLINLRDVSERHALEQALRHEEQLSRAVLNSLNANIAVLDAQGSIVRVNDSWETFAQENGDPDLTTTGIGTNYFEVCRQSDEPTSKAVLVGMLEVLAGRAPTFELEYPCDSSTGPMWFLMRVKPLSAADMQGLVVSHIDVTAFHLGMVAQGEEKAVVEQLARSQVELELFGGLYPPRRPAPRPHEADLVAWQASYQTLLLMAVEQRLYRVEQPRAPHREALAWQMSRAGASPRDLVNVHLAVLQHLNQPSLPQQRYLLLADEGRMLLLEMMGYLASAYRKQLADLNPSI